MLRWIACGVSLAAAQVFFLAGCTQTVGSPVCIADKSPSTDLGSQGAVAAVTTNATMTTIMSLAGVLVDGGITTSTSASAPVTVFVNLRVAANFPCPVEGVSHASLVTSAGQFTNGVTSAGGASGDGGSASAGSAGVSNANVTVLLSSDDPGPNGVDAGSPEPSADAGSGEMLFGYATLQLTTQRGAQIQATVGDESSCTQVCVGALQLDGGAMATMPALVTSPTVLVPPILPPYSVAVWTTDCAAACSAYPGM